MGQGPARSPGSRGGPRRGHRDPCRNRGRGRNPGSSG
jgi:hypothetical protein